MAPARTATLTRTTKETSISLQLNLDGAGAGEINTGLRFFDHMLETLVLHARLDLTLSCSGDLAVDDHHTIEDCAIALGAAFDQALGERRGIRRFGFGYAPMDESLARTVIDLSGRPASVVNLECCRKSIGQVATENLAHFVASFATSMRASIHVDVLRGINDHHKIEAAFKSLALALFTACELTAGSDVPSAKGTLR